MKLLALSGSLRSASYNTALLRAAQEAAPANATVEIGSLAGIPVYDSDLQAKGIPQAVDALTAAIRAADGLLIATPEYNYSIPGGLKNAIDWVSRMEDQPFNGKAIAILGASMGNLGTSRSQYHLRQVFVFLNGLVMNRPEVFVGAVHSKFDEAGNLTDAGTREFLGSYMESVAEWVKQVRRMQGSD